MKLANLGIKKRPKEARDDKVHRLLYHAIPVASAGLRVATMYGAATNSPAVGLGAALAGQALNVLGTNAVYHIASKGK
jgi:hypothetical protein